MKEGVTMSDLYDRAREANPAGAREVWDDYCSDRVGANETAAKLAMMVAPGVVETWACPFCGGENPANVPDCGSCGREGVRP